MCCVHATRAVTCTSTPPASRRSFTLPANSTAPPLARYVQRWLDHTTSPVSHVLCACVCVCVLLQPPSKASPIAKNRPLVYGSPPFVNHRTLFMHQLVSWLRNWKMDADLPIMYAVCVCGLVVPDRRTHQWLCAARRLRDLPVDLYQLFLHVKARGGNDQVSVLGLGPLGCVPGSSRR